ncbi:MAG: hypothetical protein R3B40_14820, partial [Polyangiales bacterium]
VPSVTRGWTREEQQLAYWSLAAHLLSAPAQEFVYRIIYGGGDMLSYLRTGEVLAELMRMDPLRMVPEVFDVLIQREPFLPFHVRGQGSSTGSMAAISAFLNLVVGGSLAVQGAVIGLVSFTGKCAAHSTFREGVGPRAQRMVAVAQLMLPSTVFWSAAILKEAVIAGAVGWLIFAMGRLIRSRGADVRAVVLMIVCGAVIGLIKAYVLIGFAAGFGAWIYASRSGSGSRVFRVRPLWLGVGFALSVLLVGGVGRLFPQFDVEVVGERIAFLQAYSEQGGSSYEVGDAQERSLVGQMAFAPVALFSSFFRPLPFEVTSVTAAVNALEVMVVVPLFVMAYRRRTLGEALRRLFVSPALAFALVYCVVLGIGVGLATTNLGTLSRYRTPFYGTFVTLLVLMYVPSQWLAATSKAEREVGDGMAHARGPSLSRP